MRKFNKHHVDWSVEFDDKTIAQVREIVDGFAKQYGEDAVLEVEYDWDSVNFHINIPIKETEEERLEREAKELAKAKKQEEADRKRYENLKQKYNW